MAAGQPTGAGTAEAREARGSARCGAGRTLLTVLSSTNRMACTVAPVAGCRSTRKALLPFPRTACSRPLTSTCVPPAPCFWWHKASEVGEKIIAISRLQIAKRKIEHQVSLIQCLPRQERDARRETSQHLIRSGQQRAKQVPHRDAPALTTHMNA